MSEYDKWMIIGLILVIVGLSTQIFFLVMMLIELGAK